VERILVVAVPPGRKREGGSEREEARGRKREGESALE
jgi:hypothetical protein